LRISDVVYMHNRKENVFAEFCHAPNKKREETKTAISSATQKSLFGQTLTHIYPYYIYFEEIVLIILLYYIILYYIILNRQFHTGRLQC
jgi:hypothetical protein